MANLKKVEKQNIVIKVSPVDLPSVDNAGEWTFVGSRVPEIKDINGVTHGKKRYPEDENRKVMYVRHIGSKKFRDDASSRFLIDIPKHFFHPEDGTFTARPAYAESDILHVLWTGNAGQGSGWIDLNYDERGASVSSPVGEADCAKWS